MYKNYIFDLYGTLIDINTDENDDNLWDKMILYYGYNNAFYTKNELKKAYFENLRYFETELRNSIKSEFIEININEVFKKLYEDKNVFLSDEKIILTSQFFRICSTKYIKLYDGVIDLLKTLKSKNKKIYLLSNAQYDFTYPELIYLDLFKYFDGILISSIEKIKKPDVNFFKTLIDRYQLNVNESIMIGNDKSCDILPTKYLNMDSLYINSNISPKNDKKLSIKATFNIKSKDFYTITKMIIK